MPHHVLGADLAADEGKRHGKLHLAPAAEGVSNILIVGDRIQGEDVDRPAALDVLDEGGLASGVRTRLVVVPPFSRQIAATLWRTPLPSCREPVGR